MVDYIKNLVKDRDNPYEIDAELAVRKILEKGTDYTIELQKNEDRYGYDIESFKYYINGGEWEKRSVAYIEVEVSEKWKTKYPDNWHTYSFLARKVFVFDYEIYQYTDCLKSDYEKTIYIILNKTLTDACACDIHTISTFEKKVISITGDLRKDTLLRTSLQDNNIRRGIPECLKYIRSFINERAGGGLCI